MPLAPHDTISILFVCLGNICRSPLAEGVFRTLVEENGLAERFKIDSAALGAYHIGSPPDPRSIAVAANYGIDISRQRCRKVVQDDFYTFDYIIGMDLPNVERLRRMAPATSRARIDMFMTIAMGNKLQIPDPYNSTPEGFNIVYKLILEASSHLLARLINE